MRNTGSTRRPSRGSPRCLGVVSGYVLKVLRESLGLTQVTLAEKLQVDVGTVQGWESGRRPLTALRTSDLTRLRTRLVALGSPLDIFSVLRAALEADLVIGDAVEAAGTLRPAGEHLLAAHVHRRDLNSLITWPFTGKPPRQLVDLMRDVRVPRRGPVADRPQLDAEERSRFFDHLLLTADTYRDDTNSLLRRQAFYLLGFDDRSDSNEWLRVEQRKTLLPAGRVEHVPAWVAMRSAAVAVAQHGDREPLKGFVEWGLKSSQHEQANLAYWAYWVGEIREAQADDAFMAKDAVTWTGLRLFDHLVDRLDPTTAQIDLNVRTLWALVLARPAVVQLQPAVARRSSLDRVERVLGHPELEPDTRQELASVTYALRVADR